VLLFGYVTMRVWNAVLPDISSLPPLTFWQAVGLLVLARNGALIAWIVMLLKSQTETVGAKTLAEVLEPSAQTT